MKLKCKKCATLFAERLIPYYGNDDKVWDSFYVPEELYNPKDFRKCYDPDYENYQIITSGIVDISTNENITRYYVSIDTLKNFYFYDGWGEGCCGYNNEHTYCVNCNILIGRYSTECYTGRFISLNPESVEMIPEFEMLGVKV